VPQKAKISSSFCFGFALRNHGDKTANRSEFSRRFAMQFLSAHLLCKSGEEQKREGAMAEEKEEQRKRKYERAENAQRSSHGHTKKTDEEESSSSDYGFSRLVPGV